MNNLEVLLKLIPEVQQAHGSSHVQLELHEGSYRDYNITGDEPDNFSVELCLQEDGTPDLILYCTTDEERFTDSSTVHLATRTLSYTNDKNNGLHWFVLNYPYNQSRYNAHLRVNENYIHKESLYVDLQSEEDIFQKSLVFSYEPEVLKEIVEIGAELNVHDKNVKVIFEFPNKENLNDILLMMIEDLNAYKNKQNSLGRSGEKWIPKCNRPIF